jgi:hypothetical protein
MDRPIPSRRTGRGDRSRRMIERSTREFAYREGYPPSLGWAFVRSPGERSFRQSGVKSSPSSSTMAAPASR